MIRSLLMAGVLLAAGAAQAQTSAPVAAFGPDAPKAAPKKVASDEDVICKIEDPPTGTRLGGRKMCATRAQWRQGQLDAAQGIQTFQNNATHSNGPEH